MGSATDAEADIGLATVVSEMQNVKRVGKRTILHKSVEAELWRPSTPQLGKRSPVHSGQVHGGTLGYSGGRGRPIHSIFYMYVHDIAGYRQRD